MATRRAHEVIAAALRDLGVDARPIDGWVYFSLADGGVMCISAEYGASLDSSRYPLTPSWFVAAPTESDRDVK